MKRREQNPTARRIQKLRQRLAQRPRSVRPAELAKLLEWCGWHLVRFHGDHAIFSKPGRRSYTLDWRTPHVFPVYVRDVLELTEQDVLELTKESDDDDQDDR